MSKNNHTDFIKKSITCILEEAVVASAGISSGIETYPLCDYIMQSVFLKMTGFQEQKMKCICWELATSDYEYRYEFTKNPLGECSNYKDKNKIYQDLIEQIRKHISDFKISDDIKNNILTNTKSEIEKVFSYTNLLIWAQDDFNEYANIINEIEGNCFAYTFKNEQTNKNTYSLFSDCSHCPKNGNGKNKNVPKCSNTKNWKEIYNVLYKHRNKCAHNTQSYQQNLPTLKTLANEDYQYENYFVRFAILILIDKIFIELYDKYLEVLEDKI